MRSVIFFMSFIIFILLLYSLIPECVHPFFCYLEIIVQFIIISAVLSIIATVFPTVIPILFYCYSTSRSKTIACGCSYYGSAISVGPKNIA